MDLKTLILVVVVISGIFSCSSAFELKCKFQTVGWDDVIGPAYTCAAQNLNLTTPKQKITKIHGHHPVSGLNDNMKVNTIFIFEQICNYFPAGVDEFFDGLEGIAVQKSALKKITKYDLKPFYNLKSLSLYGNELTTLESNLFMYNKKLKLIALFNNKLKHVFASNIFEGLYYLDRVHLSSNPCINEETLGYDKIEQLKAKLTANCPVTQTMIDVAEVEDEMFKFELENRKLRENLEAVTKSFVNTRRQLENTKELYNSSGARDTKDSLDVELKECQLEKADLIDLIQQLEVVTINCSPAYSSSNSTSVINICKVIGLKVLKAHIQVVNVKMNQSKHLRTDPIHELEINGQQTLFLPLNLTTFFPKLTKITVRNSELIEINEQAFIGLIDLTELNLAHNKLSDVKRGNFRTVGGLLKLDLSFNSIEVIEDSAFVNLLLLVELRLNNNHLVKLSSKLFKPNKNLKILMLNGNRLKQIASNLFDLCCHQIQNIDLTKNECVDSRFPEESMASLREVFTLNCSVPIDFECRFETEDRDYACFAENAVIQTDNIIIENVRGEHKVGMNLEKVTVLKAFNQTMEHLPQNLASFFPNLKALWVEDSRLKKIEKLTLAGLSKIEVLKIKRNDLVELSDDTFAGNDKLQDVDFSYNSIEKLSSECFARLSNLKSITLSNNKLKTLSADIISAGNSIEKFIFGQNNLSSINPQIVQRLLQAKLIDFSENQCIDSKYDQAENDEKKIMEIFGEISFKCD